MNLCKRKFYIGIGNLEIGRFNRKGINLLTNAIKILEKKRFDFEIVEFGNKEKFTIENSKIKIKSLGIIKDDSVLRDISNKPRKNESRTPIILSISESETRIPRPPQADFFRRKIKYFFWTN